MPPGTYRGLPAFVFTLHGRQIVALWFLTTAVAAMPSFFTVDTVTDELVRIDVSTGTTNVVGALGMDAVDPDLARTADGRLWGLNSVAGSRVDLWEISPLTGSIISSTQVLDVTGAAVLGAEGLGSNGNQLTIGYRAGGNISLSDTFANLSMTGVTSAPVTVNFDIDGLSLDALFHRRHFPHLSGFSCPQKVSLSGEPCPHYLIL